MILLLFLFVFNTLVLFLLGKNGINLLLSFTFIVLFNFLVLVSYSHASISIPNIDLIKKLDSKIIQLSDLSNCTLTITSGKRSKERNFRVGGARNSYHLKDLARDIITDKDCKYSYLQLGYMAKLLFPGVIVYRSHLHLDMRANKFHAKKILDRFILL